MLNSGSLGVFWGLGLVEPGLHVWQGKPPLENLPGGQASQAASFSLPRCALYFPGVQREHAVSPSKSPYVPLPQRVQSSLLESPGRFPYLPRGHSVGSSAPGGQKEPAGHLFALSLALPSGQKKPALQAPVQFRSRRSVSPFPKRPALQGPAHVLDV